MGEPSKVMVIDHGMGNLRSVTYKIGKLGVQAQLVSHPEEVERADRIILPGVGSFAACMSNLRALDLIEVLNRKVLEQRTPILGICLGMQLLARHSEEGDAEGLGWVAAQVKRFDFTGSQANLWIPHVGWRPLRPAHPSPLLEGVAPDQHFYFTHSYHVCCEDREDVAAWAHYGYDFVAALQHDNIYGVQFHPEKSHHRGLIIINNFLQRS